MLNLTDDKPSPLPGEAESGSYRALHADGTNARMDEAVFPILRQLSSGIWQLIGTGFFITTNGIFATAKHVLLDVIDDRGKQINPISLIQFLPGNKYMIRPIVRCMTHGYADVAVGIAARGKNINDGSELLNKCLVLSTRPTRHICTYAYPKTIVKFESPNQEIHFYPTFYDGELEDYHPNGRDRVVLPGPCYRTNIVLHGGASGGPVFSHNGRVFGINSTGMGADLPVSFISRINELLPLEVTGVMFPESEERPVTILELAQRGFVVFDPPLLNATERQMVDDESQPSDLRRGKSSAGR